MCGRVRVLPRRDECGCLGVEGEVLWRGGRRGWRLQHAGAGLLLLRVNSVSEDVSGGVIGGWGAGVLGTGKGGLEEAKVKLGR